MTNNEILRADLLDIIFDKRNKDYGAYTLRRDYNHRLLMALSAAAAIILSFILLNTFINKKEPVIPENKTNTGYVLKTVELKLKEPEIPREKIKSKPVEKIATIKHVSTIRIKPDIKVKTVIPTVDDIKGKQIANVTTDGKPKDDIVKPVEPVITNTNGGGNDDQPNNFKPEERQPEFPGGPEALMRFMKKNLITPDELEAGDMKKVLVKFKVDADGSISEIQVIQTGGSAFDREVTRVCKKMPRWSPAVQNGVNVSMGYVLPVTFIGVEE